MSRCTAASALLALCLCGSGQAAERNGAAESAPMDAVGIAFLRARLNANPGDHLARLELARALAASGRPIAARALLDPLRTLDPAAAARAESLALQLDWQLYNAEPAGSTQRSVRRQTLEYGLRRALRRDLPAMDFAHLADLALQLEQPQLAARFYAVLSQREPARAAVWLARSARWQLAAGLNEAAADSYIRATSLPGAGKRRSEYALAAIDAVLASGEPQRAYRVAERLLAQSPGLPALRLRAVQVAESVGQHGRALDWLAILTSEPQAADHLILRQRDLALAAGELSLATQAAERLLARHPEDRELRAELAMLHEWRGHFAAALRHWRHLALGEVHDPRALKRAADLHAQLGETEPAVALLRRHLRRSPDDHASREWLAQTSEWGGDPHTALEEWLVLAERRGSARDYAEVERLAPMLHEHAATARLWQLRERRDGLTETQYLALAGALQRSGQLAAEVDALGRATAAHPRSAVLWRSRAQAAERAGQLQQALDDWRASDRRLGAREESRAARARLLLALGRLPAAARLARQLGETAACQRLAGEIAWQAGDGEQAMRRYAALWADGARDAVTVERHIGLVRQRQGWRQANRLRVQAFQQLGHWHRLANALADAQRDNDWVAVRGLLRHAAGSPELTAEENFWLVAAAAAEAGNDPLGARLAYSRAVLINPASEARPALLWSLIDQRDQTQLRRLLHDWAESAQHDRRLWPAFAAGLLQLGQSQAALRWYRRLAAEAEQEPLWQLDFADALAAAGYRDTAFRVSRHALRQLGDDGLQGLQNGLDIRIAAALESHWSPLAADHWVAAQVSAGTPAARDMLSLAEWQLRRERSARARRWLAERHRQRLQNPAWLEMAVALADDDLDRIDTLLEQRERELAALPRVLAQRRLGRIGEALDTALTGLAESRDPAVSSALRGEAVALRSLRPHDITFAVERLKLDDLQIESRALELRLSGDRGTFVLGARQADLRGSPGLSGDEEQLDLGYRWEHRWGETTLGFGARKTLGQTVPRWQLAHSLNLSSHWRFRLGLAEGLASEDSEALRGLASTRQLDFSLSGRPGARHFVELRGARHQHRAVGGGALARGWSLGAEAGRQLGGQTWSLRAGASVAWLGNRAARSLPGSIAAALPGSRLEDVVPRRFSALGLRLRAARGEPLADYPQIASPRVFAELWLGLRHSGDNPLRGDSAGLLSLGVASSLLGGDELGLSLHLDSAGTADGRRLKLWYRHPFDR